MTQHCDDLIPALVRAADGTLSAQEQATLSAHLATCAACTEALADQQAMRQALVTLAETPQTTFVGTRVMAQLRAERPATTWLESLDWKRWTWRLVPVAAELMLVRKQAVTAELVLLPVWFQLQPVLPRRWPQG